MSRNESRVIERRGRGTRARVPNFSTLPLVNPFSIT
jgi:hypothetical protein